MARVWLLPCLFVGALLWPATNASACSCAAGTPLCQSVWATPVVFAGEVIEIEDIHPSSGRTRFPGRLVRFKVEQAYRGDVGEILEIATGSGYGDCGYRFNRGGRYLVYAHENKGQLTTSVCSRTRPLSRAANDLKYLETPPSPGQAARVSGRVFLSGPRERPARDYQVVLSNTERQWTARTDEDGRFEFDGVPTGRYDIRVEVADTEHVYGGPPSGGVLELPDPRACATAHFRIVPNGRIATRLVDRDGQPRAGVRVEVVEAGGARHAVSSATSDGKGDVTLSPLPPGRYIVAINHSQAAAPSQPFPRVYYPGVAEPKSATAVTLEAGERRELEAFRLPAPLREHDLTGLITWPDGQPAEGARVGVIGAHTSVQTHSVTTGPDGTFSIPVYDGLTYVVNAWHPGSAPNRAASQARAQEVVAGDTMKAVHLVLRPRR